MTESAEKTLTAPPRLSARQALARVRDLLSAPNGWTRGTESRDADGKPIAWFLKGAVAFDVRGAFLRVGAEAQMDMAEPIRLFQAAGGSFEAAWNDARYQTKANILHTLERAHRAAKRAEERGL